MTICYRPIYYILFKTLYTVEEGNDLYRLGARSLNASRIRLRVNDNGSRVYLVAGHGVETTSVAVREDVALAIETDSEFKVSGGWTLHRATFECRRTYAVPSSW